MSGQPIPWTAERVVVEAFVRLPAEAGRRKSDFTLRLPGKSPVPATSLRRVEDEDCHQVVFRLPPPGATVTAEVRYREQSVAWLDLPYLGREAYLRGLSIEMPTLAVRLGGETVACQTFVPSQCRGLVATAKLSSSTNLLPLLGLPIQVEFVCERSGATIRVPASLTTSQLLERTALITVVPRRHPRRLGNWSASWLAGEHVLARQCIRGISQKAFQKSLRIAESRFLVQDGDGPCQLADQAPRPDANARVGPCFFVRSSEVGMAGLCQVQVSAQVPGAVRSPVMLDQELVVSDGPTMIAPGTLDPGDLHQVAGFELQVAGRLLGSLSLRPVPTASFTSEGTYAAPVEYVWTEAAEEEMTERLNRLLGA